MELAVYFSHFEDLLEVEEAVRFIDYGRMSSLLAELVFTNVNTDEYAGNLFAAEFMDTALREGCRLSRLYFGQEFCEHLIPSPEELEKAFYFARQVDWDFTYATGAVTDAGLDRIAANLEFLAGAQPLSEVVVNDWGVLSVLRRDFPGLRPVLGRLLSKQLRLARYTVHPRPVNLAETAAAEEEIRRNQDQALRSLELSLAGYRDQLRRWGVERVDLDIVPQGADLPPDAYGFGLGCYVPWTYVSGGRNCSTAAVADPVREFVAVDGKCPRPCREINTSSVLSDAQEIMLQRGNSVFLFNLSFAAPYLDGRIPTDRIVVEPYIPV